MKIREQKKKNIIVLFLILSLSLGLGYALLRTNLTINGTSKIKGNTWDVHWENVQVTEGSVELSTGDVGAAIGSNTTEVSYAITLNQPGDFYEFTVDAVNAGSIDAMIDVITSTYQIGEGTVTEITSENLPTYLNYSVTYGDNIPLTANQELKAGETETYKVRIEFKRDIEESDLPDTMQSIVFTFGVDYVQGDSNATSVPHPSLNNYVVTSLQMHIGKVMPEGVNVRNTSQLALADWQDIVSSSDYYYPVYLKHTIENDLVTESYVGFVISDAFKTYLKNTYCDSDSTCEAKYDALVNGNYLLRGANEELDSASITPYAESNIEVIRQAFGSLADDTSVCSQTDINQLECSLDGFKVLSDMNGSVVAGMEQSQSSCSVYYDGVSQCHS